MSMKLTKVVADAEAFITIGVDWKYEHITED